MLSICRQLVFKLEGILEISWSNQPHCFLDRLHDSPEIAQESEWQAEQAGDPFCSLPDAPLQPRLPCKSHWEHLKV